ncbi:MAG: hypothetical protein J5938_06100 [Clostridia bacterium]|nr:hypothetical protein [Clostridia bacterium]
MKTRIFRMVSLLLVLSFFLALPLTLPQAEAADLSDGKYKGIDYNRFTQKLDQFADSFDVELTMHTLKFKGTLTGATALTVEEMNAIINEVLNTLHMTVAGVEILSSIGADLDGKVDKEIAKKLLVALSNYIPSPTPVFGASDVAKVIAYGPPESSVPDAGFAIGATKGIVVDALNDAMEANEKAIIEAAKAAKKVPKIPVSAGVASFALNSIDVALELADTEQFDKFCNEMTKLFEKIAEFYIRCSQKMNDLAEKKNANRIRISFKDAKCDADPCVFLGVDNVTTQFTLNGDLYLKTGDTVVAAGDNSGTYEGELTLVLEGKNFGECFDARFSDSSDIWLYGQRINDWCQILYKFEGMPNARSELLSKFIPKVNKPTVLKRTLVGKFTADIRSWTAGTLKPSLSGAFNNVSDKTEFTFEMNFGQEMRSTVSVDRNGTHIDLGQPVQQWHVKSTGRGLDAMHVTWVGNEAARVWLNGQSVGQEMYSGDGQDVPLTQRDIGTVFYPLEFAPEITVTVPKTVKP